MDRIDRRTFLATGIKTGAALAAWAWSLTRWPTPCRRRRLGRGIRPGLRRPSRSSARSHHHRGGRPGRGRPRRRAVRLAGGRRPPGCRPERLPDRGHRARTVHRRRSGTRARWRRASQAFVRLRRPDPGGRLPVPLDGAGRRTAPASGASPARPPPSPPGCAPPTGRRCGCGPGPADPGQEEYTYLRTTRTLPGGHHRPRHRLRGRRPQVPAVGQRGPGRHRPELLLPRRAVLPGHRCHLGRCEPGGANAVGVLHHWYGPGQGRPTSAPGLLVQVAVHYTDGKVVTIGSDGSWRTRRAEWLPAPQRNNDGGDFVEWIDGRLAPIGWSGGRLRRPGVGAGRGAGPGGHRALHPPLRPAHPDQPSTRWRRSRSGPCPPGRWWSTSARSTPDGPWWPSAHGVDGHTVPMHVGYTLDPDGSVSTTHNTQGTDLSFSYIQRAGAQTFEPYSYLGFRYLQIDDPGRGPRPATRSPSWPATPPCPTWPAATFASSDPMLDEVWALCAHSGPLHLPGAVHRHADPGEGPVPVGLGQRVPDGHADLRRAEPELAGPAGHGPGPGPLLAHHRAGQRGLPQRRRGPGLPDLHRHVPRVGVAVLPVDRGPRHPGRPAARPSLRLSDYLVGPSTRPPG